MINLCQSEELGLSCFGCCGNSYKGKKRILRDIRKNTLKWKNKKSTPKFMKRSLNLHDSGVCFNVIYKDEKFYCPGHPEINNGRDFRNLDKDCERQFECKTHFILNKWDKEKQEKFIEFIKSKKLDSYVYSIKMDNGSLMKDFEKKK